MAFLRALWGNWLTTMSGAASVAFWLVSAVAEGTSIPVSIRVGFILASGCSLYYAAYRVWKDTSDRCAAAIAAQESRWQQAQEEWAQQKQKWAEERQNLEQQLQEVRRRLLDPGLVLKRRELAGFLDRLSTIATAIERHEPDATRRLSEVEIEAQRYLDRHFPEYPGLRKAYSVDADWPQHASMTTLPILRERCRQRIEVIQDLLGLHEGE